MTDITYGSKYDRAASTTDVAKAIRKDIKALVKDGTIPAVRYSVRSKYFSGGSSIDVVVKDLNMAKRDWFALRDILNAVVAAYNFDGSDIMTDYFNVNFYGNVSACWQTSVIVAPSCPNGHEGSMPWTGSMHRCQDCNLIFEA